MSGPEVAAWLLERLLWMAATVVVGTLVLLLVVDGSRQLWQWATGDHARECRDRIRRSGWDVRCRWRPWSMYAWTMEARRDYHPTEWPAPGTEGAGQRGYRVRVHGPYDHGWRMLELATQKIDQGAWRL